MATISRAYITSLLRPGANTIFGDWEIHGALWKDIYAQYTSNKSIEYDIEIQGLGMAQIKAEGAPFATGEMKQIYTTSYQMLTYGIGFTITREALLDNQYPDQFPQQAMNLRHSLEVVKNVNGAFPFNNALNPALTGSDGMPLLSSAHPTVNGALANTFTNYVGLNETTLEDLITMVKTWTNVAGLPINLSPVRLLVPPALQYQASRLLNGMDRTATANREISALVHDKYIPGGYSVNRFILNPGFWGFLTDEANGFKYFSKDKPEMDYICDPATNNVSVYMGERYGLGYSNWRSFAGSIGPA